MFSAVLTGQARNVLDAARARGFRIAAAESCTGGLVMALLTSVPGSSGMVDRGFVTYSNDAKAEQLGVPMALIEAHGAVSADVARAMAEGALKNSRADISVAITGIAGPDGGSETKPVGLVQFGAARKGGPILQREMRFGAIGRDCVREKSVEEALKLLMELMA